MESYYSQLTRQQRADPCLPAGRLDHPPAGGPGWQSYGGRSQITSGM